MPKPTRKLKEAHKAQDLAAIDTATAELNNVFQAASQDLYNAQNAQTGGPSTENAPTGDNKGDASDGNVTDVDFEEVK